jgi:tripartite-type tricarboxylate transporter receptor subunit TctC
MKMNMARIMQACAISMAIIGTSIAQAKDNYPSKPITVIVPSPPGGPSDLITRLIATHLSPIIGQPVIVENRTGASGIVGMQALSRAAPDGYTLALSSLVYQVLNPALFKEKLPYDPSKLSTVSILAHVPYMMVGSKAFKAKDAKEAINLSKENPGKYNYGIPGGTGNTAHIMSELLKKEAGIDVMAIPYQGDGLALNAIIGGEIQWQFTTTLGSALQLVKSNSIKALAVATPERLKILPDTPTFAELGYPGVEGSTWFTFVVSKDVPERIQAKLNGALEKTLQLPQVRERIESMGSTVGGGDLEKVRSFINAQTPIWTERVNSLNISSGK